MGGYVTPYKGFALLYELRNADLTLTTDQRFTKTFAGLLCFPRLGYAVVKSGGYQTACLGGIYTGPNKTGTVVVPASTTWSGMTPGKTMIVNQTVVLQAADNTGAEFFLSLSTGNGGPLIADVFFYGPVID